MCEVGAGVGAVAGRGTGLGELEDAGVRAEAEALVGTLNEDSRLGRGASRGVAHLFASKYARNIPIRLATFQVNKYLRLTQLVFGALENLLLIFRFVKSV